MDINEKTPRPEGRPEGQSEENKSRDGKRPHNRPNHHRRGNLAPGVSATPKRQADGGQNQV